MSQPHNELTRLAAVALLGTERGDLPAPDAATLYGAFAATQTSGNASVDLLNRAGTLSLYSEAGTPPLRRRQPIRGQTESAKRADVRPAKLTSAADHHQQLAAMVNGKFDECLGEYLHLLAAKGETVPAVYLPQLLHKAVRKSSLRAMLLPVLGTTGTWLAQQQPAWAYATAAATTWDGARTIWEAGNAASRQAFLRQLRDTKPTLGRELVEHSWKRDDLSTRSWALRALRDGLSIDDEPFLESALDDRVHTIRRHAADLLAHLPTSRLCQRMREVAGTHLQWTPDAETQITVHPPTEISPQMVRDGVVIRKGKNAALNQGNQLIDIVAAVPLTHWEATWQASPAEILNAAVSSRWPNTLYKAFALATQRQQNAVWANALLEHLGLTSVTGRVFAVLTPADADRQVRRIVADIADGDTQPLLDKEHPLLVALRRWPHTWTAVMVEQWLHSLAETLVFMGQDSSDETKVDSLLSSTIKQCARSCPPEMFGLVYDELNRLSQQRSPQQPALQSALALVDFRRRIYGA